MNTVKLFDVTSGLEEHVRLAVNNQNVGSFTLTDYLQQMMLQSNDDTNTYYHYFHTYDDYIII